MNSAQRRGRRANVACLAATALLAVGSTAPPAAATASDLSHLASALTPEFGWYDSAPNGPQIGQTLTASQLSALGVDTSVLDNMADGSASIPSAAEHAGSIAPANQAVMEQQEDVSPTASAAASMGAQATSKNDVLHQWTDGLQGTTYYRRGVWDGVTGWGDAKITAYHNLSWKPVKVVSQHPAAWHVSGKTSVNFYGEFDHYKCSGWWIFRSCSVVGKLTVTVITDYRLYGPYPQTFGAFNAYCIGVVSCPDWVKNSINI